MDNLGLQERIRNALKKKHYTRENLFRFELGVGNIYVQLNQLCFACQIMVIKYTRLALLIYTLTKARLIRQRLSLYVALQPNFIQTNLIKFVVPST